MPDLGGRPLECTEDVIAKLEYAFRDGAHIYEACAMADIAPSTYYRWLKTIEGFETRMDVAKDYVTEIAQAVVARSITKKKDPETAKWWLERRKKDKFSTRSEITGKDGKDLPAPILGGQAKENV